MYCHQRDLIKGLNDDDLVQPHVLCGKCRAICEQSRLLRDVPEKYSVFTGRGDFAAGASSADIEESYQHGTLSEIEASCLSGCFLCGFIYYLHFRPAHSQNELIWDTYILSSERFHMNVIARDSTRECRIEYKGCFNGTIRIYVDGDERMPPAETYSPAQLAVSTKSSGSFELARKWLDDCKINHELCAHSGMPFGSGALKRGFSRFLPTRLIDVSGRNPRLVITAGMSPQDQNRDYVALSHCWGGKEILRLLTTNLDSMIKGIRTLNLSNTFRDAILITRRLGYQYIWIDSLCIIQDSKADWKIEAGLMAQVYGNADFTIAAIGADGDAGCFRRRNPLLRRPGKLLRVGGVSVYGYGFIYAGEHNVLEGDPGIPGLANLPLLRRAWVVQERLISNRIIFYGYPGLIWECATFTASEFRPRIYPVPKLTYADDPIKFALRRTLRASVQSDDSTRLPLLDVWFRIVDIYTRSSVTFAADRVAALAGIVIMIKSSTRMEYVAGLWPELFPEVLLLVACVSAAGSFATLMVLARIERTDQQPSHSSPENVVNSIIQYSGRGTTGSITIPENSVLGEISKGELKVTGVLRKVHFPIDDDTGEVIAGTIIYTKPTRLKEKGSNPLGSHTYLPAVVPHPSFDLHLLLLKRIRYQIEHRPARGPEQTYETQIEEQGLLLVPHTDQSGWVKVGTFLDITLADWDGEAWELLFPRVGEVKEEDETSITLH